MGSYNLSYTGAQVNTILSNAEAHTAPGSKTNPHGTTKSDVGLGNVGNFKAVSTVASQGLSNAEKVNARANIGAISNKDLSDAINNLASIAVFE